MRTAYWALTGIVILLALFFSFTAPSPTLPGVTVNQADGWLSVLTASSVLLGACIGGLLGVEARARVHFRPRESAIEFHKRVIKRGLYGTLAYATGGLILACLGTVLGGPLLLTFSESLVGVATTRLAAVPFAAIGAGAIAYWQAIVRQDWGGRNALSS